MMQQRPNVDAVVGLSEPTKEAPCLEDLLQDQFSQLCQEYNFSTFQASIAARTLQYEGQVRKPLLKKKMDGLKEKIQLTLEFVEF